VDLSFWHGRLATALVLFAALAGVYGLVEYFRRQSVSPNYWGIIVVGNLLAVGQGLLGVVLALGGGQPARGIIHIIYGVVALSWIPMINFVSSVVNKEKQARRETLLVALISLFQAGIAWRAITTATVAGAGI
jgi:tetraacyldisaccharide-1-P 4'-kinase